MSGQKQHSQARPPAAISGLAAVVALAVLLAFGASPARAQNVEFRQISSPAGVINQTTFPTAGSQISTVTAPATISGYRFTHWTLNGMRAGDLAGGGANPIFFTIVEPVEAVANYVLESADSDGDGVLDWLEIYYFGNLNLAADDDPDGDRFTILEELTLGYHPGLHDLRSQGGLSRRRGQLIAVNDPGPGPDPDPDPDPHPELADLDGDEFLRWREDLRGYLDTSYDRLNEGGVSRRRSAPIFAVPIANFARLVEASTPGGVVDQERVVPAGSTVNLTTAPLTHDGYQFTGWFANEQRLDSPPRNQPTPITVHVDTLAIARYHDGTADTDADGVPDWVEWYSFDSLANNLDSDPDGDGLPLRVELFRGYSTIAPDVLDPGGVSRRRSALVDVGPAAGFPYSMVSAPGGMVNLAGFVAPGTVVTSPDLGSSTNGNFRFAFWEVNGVRQTDPGGYSRGGISFPVSAPTVAVARYADTTLDDDFDGIADWYELAHFGSLNRSPSNDGDNDGITLGGEIFRGYSPLVRDHLAAGGISRRRSDLVGVNAVPLSAAPYVTVNGTTDVTPTGARLSAFVNGVGLESTVYFEYGPTMSYGARTPTRTIGAGSGPVIVAETITGLAPAAIHHFRVVAENSVGQRITPDYTFSTFWDAVATEGFEDGDVGDRWQIMGGVWQIGPPMSGPEGAFAGAASAGTNLAGDYAPGTDSRIISPLFEVPALDQFPHLRFNHWWNFGLGDHGAVEIREGTTGAWKVAATFTGPFTTWIEKSLDLSAYAGRQIQVAFRIKADADANVGPGWFVDEVRLVTGEVDSWLPNSLDTYPVADFWRDWTVTGTVWEAGPPTAGPAGAFDGETCAATVLGGNYPINADSRLVSPFFQVPAAALNPRFRFWHWFDFGAGDKGAVEIRRHGGQWEELLGFGGNSGGGWSTPSLDLRSFAGQWVQVAFRLRSDASVQRAGWYVDAARITTGAEVLKNPETFEGETGDWRSDFTGLWQIGRPTSGPGSAHGGSNVAATNLSGNYPANISARLESPAFLVGDPGANRLITLRFWQWHQFGNGDQGSLGISVRDGEVWSDWVPALTVTGSSGGWQQRVLDLGSYRGKTVKLGFLLTADSDGSTGPGWYFDDLEITSVVRGELAAGAPVQNDIAANGDFQYYALTLDTAGPLILSLSHTGVGNRIELFASRTLLPSRGAHEFGDASGPGANRELLIPWASPGTWYILVYADTVVTPGSFNLQAVTPGVALTSSTPASHASNAPVTMTLSGAGFRSGAAVEMVSDSGTAIAASSVTHDSFTSLTATFGANSLPPGVYDVRIRDIDGGSAVLADAFTSLAAGEPRLETKLIMPGAIRPGAPATIYIEYANTGNASMPAPLLQLRPREGSLNRPILTLDPAITVQTFWSGDSNLPPGASTEIFILGSGAQAGILQPGERRQVPVYFSSLLQPWAATSLDMEIRYWTADDASPIDWASRKIQLRPPTLNAAVWDIVFANLTGDLGTTADYVRMLNENATFLGRLGQRVIDVRELWNFELQQAYGYSPLPVIGSATDAAVSSPGTPLSIGRRFSSNLRSRWETGPFGRGWYTPWQTRLLVEHNGAIVRIVGEGGSARVFSRDTRNGNYFSGAGDSSKLSAVGGGYELREPNGTVTRFNSSGQIALVDDANGNRVMASYNAGRVATLAHSSGASISVSYGSHGFVSRIVESTGRSADFTYDGAYLASVTTDDGKVTQYTYHTTGAPARLHALTSITRGGVTRTFSWDDRGRLAESAIPAAGQTIGFGYDEAGGVNISDVAGTTSFFFDHRGLLAKTVDPLGNTTTSEFDQDLRLKRLLLPSGDSRSFTWCSCGSPATITDELGHTTRFSYDHPLKKMTAFVDAKGNRTSYTYDAKGNLLATTYANQSVESLGAYDATGLPASLTNRRGQTSTFTYTPSGQIARRTLAEGDVADFTYDARGNLIRVTEQPVTGPEKITTYDYTPATDGDRLRKVSYPNGGWVEYFYDEQGRRSRLTDSAGGDTRYEYDVAGRLWKLRDQDNVQIVEYLYDAAARLRRINKRNGNYTTYEYDAAGQILMLVNHAPGGTPNSSFVYSYDSNGRRTRMETLDGAWTYAYDATGQLIHAVLNSIDPQIPNQDLRYQYDALGNRSSTNLNGVPTAYVSNNLNQYSSVGGIAYQHDKDGNLVSDGERIYVYDSENRLQQFSGPGGIMQYEYDSFGNRVASLLNGERTEYLLDPTGLVNVTAELDIGSGVSEFTHGLGLVAKKDSQAGVCYFDFDAIGSTVGATVQNGDQVGAASYLPFGEELSSSVDSEISSRFVGQFGVKTPLNGPIFMRARFYSHKTGRFLSNDPLDIFGGDVNLYRYVGNYPLGRVDPLGLFGVNTNFSGGVPLPGGHLAFGGGWSVGTGGVCLNANIGLGIGLPKFGFSKTLGSMPVSGWDGFSATGNYGVVEGSVTWKPGGDHGGALGISNGVGLGASVTTGWTICTPPPPLPPGSPPSGGNGSGGASASSPFIVSRDPNEKLGPVGIGPQNWITGDDALPYRINFENLGPGSKDANGDPYPTFATAPAQRVTVTDQLPAHLDWNGFRLTEIGFGDQVIAIPENRTHHAAKVGMTFNGKSFDVEIEAGINFNTGLVTVTFQSLDPTTGLPPAADIGFLPPEDGTGRGMGHVSFLVGSKAAVPTGTAIRNIAEIRFDNNEVIATNQVDPQDASKGTDPAKEALVTVDGEPPVSAITALPPVSEWGGIPVSWAGDDLGGSGVADYDVFVSVGGGAFVPWFERTQETSAVFLPTTTGIHAFYVRARDFLGQTPPTEPFAQASTKVVPELSLTNLEDGAEVLGRLGVDLALASLPAGAEIDRVEYFANGVLLGEGTGPDFRLRWFPLASGLHLLRSVAYDPSGAKSAAGEVEIEVSHVGTYAGAVKGTYLGLIQEKEPEWLTSGSMLMSSTTTGAFSFKILMGGRTLSGRGGFNPDGVAEVSIARKGTTPLRLQLVHSSVPDVDRIVGRLTDGSFDGPTISGQTFATDFVVDRRVWDAKLNPATAQAGAYTVILIHGSDGPPSADLPHGHGYGAASIATSGSLKFTGRLADGAKVSAASYLSKNAEWPLYAPIYKNNGFVIGKPSLREVVNISDGDGTLHWWKRANPKSVSYPGEIKTESRLLMSRYRVPPSNTRPLTLASLGGNVLVSLNDLNLEPATERVGTMNAGGATVIPPQGGERLALSFNLKTGSLGGSFIHPQTGAKTAVAGVFFQKQNLAVGSYLAGTAGGRILLEPHPDRLPDGNDHLPIGLAPLPVMGISLPKAESIVTPVNGVVEIRGTAKDKEGIAAVWCQVLHNGVMEAPALATGTTAWSFPVTILPGEGGRYTVIAKAIDGAGNESHLTTRSFMALLRKPLNVTVTGPGAVSRGFVGTTDRQIGQLVTITAKPARRKRFIGWKGSIESPARTIVFLMTEGMTLEAVFED